MTSIGWLADRSERSLRAALAVAAPELAGLPLQINPRPPSSNPLWWSSSAVIDASFVVKFAWSEVRARRLWREGVVLQRLKELAPALPLPEVVVLAEQPALVVTRMVPGVPLGGEWAATLAGSRAQEVGCQLGGFLARLHSIDIAEVLGGLPVVEPTAQADTDRLRRGFPRLVDHDRAALVQGWCDWVDGVLADASAGKPRVFVHGDLHGSNQVWDPAERALVAVVDFEESGAADIHFDFRYFPQNLRSLDVLLATMETYQHLSGRRLSIERVMAWNVLTVLGDALWRSEAGVALPGGGNPAGWVDDLSLRLHSLGLT